MQPHNNAVGSPSQSPPSIVFKVETLQQPWSTMAMLATSQATIKRKRIQKVLIKITAGCGPSYAIAMREREMKEEGGLNPILLPSGCFMCFDSNVK